MGRIERFAQIAEELARKELKGNARKGGPDLQPMLRHFTDDPEEGFDWCAAFVYHCVHLAGYPFKPRYTEFEGRPCLAAVGEWIRWDRATGHGFYRAATDDCFDLRRGDIVLYDDIVPNGPHDHIGVVLSVGDGAMLVAEGNVDNQSGVFVRSTADNINGRIRLPDF